MPGSSRKSIELTLAKERVALFKAAWEPFKEDTFACALGLDHILCKPLTPVLCNCEDRPEFTPEEVDLTSYDGSLSLVIQPSLTENQQYLDLIHHTALHHRSEPPSVVTTTTFAEVAASARNVELLQHLFKSPDQCVRQFYHACYSFCDPVSLVRLFAHALNGGDRDCVMYLVERFMEELTTSVKMAILETCLWLATTDKKLEMLFQELALKFGVNLVDDAGDHTPIRLTCFYDNKDVAEFLIDKGADMYAETSMGCTVAYHAYKYGGFIGGHKVLKAMLHKGLRVEAALEAHSSYFRFPLMYTFIHHNEAGLVRLLVDFGHSVNLPIRFRADSQERRITPLMLALACKRLEIASWLVENGADCNARSFISQQLDDESWTPLHMAASLGNQSIVRTLVDHGAQVDAVTASGETVMCMAFQKKLGLDVVTYLLQINAPVRSIPGTSFRVKCREGSAVAQQWSMLDLAVYSGDLLLTEVLLQSRHYHHPPQLLPLLCAEVSLHSEDQIHAMQRVQQFSVEVSRLRVSSLQVICRDTLRAACGTRLQQYVNTTTMPARLRSILLLEDVLGPLKTKEAEEEDGSDS